MGTKKEIGIIFTTPKNKRIDGWSISKKSRKVKREVKLFTSTWLTVCVISESIICGGWRCDAISFDANWLDTICLRWTFDADEQPFASIRRTLSKSRRKSSWHAQLKAPICVRPTSTCDANYVVYVSLSSYLQSNTFFFRTYNYHQWICRLTTVQHASLFPLVWNGKKWKNKNIRFTGIDRIWHFQTGRTY